MQRDISHNIIVALTWIYVNKIFFDLHFYNLIVILELHNITVQMAGEKMEIIKVKGNTYCIDTGMTYLPFYKLNNKDIILMIIIIFLSLNKRMWLLTKMTGNQQKVLRKEFLPPPKFLEIL